jgi:peptide methionine sulfoxide reductase msrA/msrB
LNFSFSGLKTNILYFLQKQTAQKLIAILKAKGIKAATELLPLGVFWPAEDYHQNYYNHKGTVPYCHAYTKRF